MHLCIYASKNLYINASIYQKATQRGSNWNHQLAQTNLMILSVQVIHEMQHMHAGSNF